MDVLEFSLTLRISNHFRLFSFKVLDGINKLNSLGVKVLAIQG